MLKLKVIITGALGHIGSALIRNDRLLDAVDELVLVDDLSTQRYVSLFHLPEGRATYRLIRGDVASALTPEVLDGAAAIVHLAGTVDPVASAADSSSLFANNLRITQHVVDQCLVTGVPLVFASSTSVYTPQSEWVDERSQELSPSSPYARCKLEEEALILEHLGPGRSLILRLGTIFGPSPGMRFQTAVNKFCWQAATGVPIEVWQTAIAQVRPYLAVQDAADSFAHAVVESIFPGRRINAVTCNVTVSDVLDAIRRCGRSPRVTMVESPIMNSLSFSAKTDAASGLGFRFTGDLQEGVRETLEWLGHLE